MLTHPTLDLLYELNLHGMAKGLKALEQTSDVGRGPVDDAQPREQRADERQSRDEVVGDRARDARGLGAAEDVEAEHRAVDRPQLRGIKASSRPSIGRYPDPRTEIHGSARRNDFRLCSRLLC